MKKLHVLCISLVFCFGCKFQPPSSTTLLTNDGCLQWQLVSCDSNVDALNSDIESSSMLTLCNSGKGFLMQGDNMLVNITWNIQTEDSISKLCWTDYSKQEYCYQVSFLNTDKLVLFKENNQKEGYEKRVICTYKPLLSNEIF